MLAEDAVKRLWDVDRVFREPDPHALDGVIVDPALRVLASAHPRLWRPGPAGGLADPAEAGGAAAPVRLVVADLVGRHRVLGPDRGGRPAAGGSVDPDGVRERGALPAVVVPNAGAVDVDELLHNIPI